MDNLHIGSIITDAHRDAIHVAVAPALAGEQLFPGQHIGIVGGVATARGQKLGIVDPFLPGPVFPEQRFWVFLYPGSITSLRHHWEHPAFQTGEGEPTKPIAAAQGQEEAKRKASETWLRDFARDGDCPNYDALIAAASGVSPEDVNGYGGYCPPYENDGKILFFQGRDAHGQIPPEFWDHVENVTGKRIGPDKRAGYFSCSC